MVSHAQPRLKYSGLVDLNCSACEVEVGAQVGG